MTTLTRYDIRRRLVEMSTLVPERFGGLSVRLYKSRHTVRWTIQASGVTQHYRYPRYADIETMNANIAQVARYIHTHYRAATEETEAKSA